MKKKYNIYAGLNGSFGGANLIDTIEAESLRVAEEYAYEAAIEIYESYEGMYGLRTVQDIMEEEDMEEDDALEVYTEEMENWLDYWAEEVE